MWVTLAVFQLPSGWMKERADSSMLSMLVTLAVFHLPMWLKASASRNILLMSVTGPRAAGPPGRAPGADGGAALYALRILADKKSG